MGCECSQWDLSNVGDDAMELHGKILYKIFLISIFLSSGHYLNACYRSYCGLS